MRAKTPGPTEAIAKKYRFVVGVSLAALEQDLNRMVEDESVFELRQVLYAQGTGFIAVIEHADKDTEHLAETTGKTGEIKKTPRKLPKKP